MKIHSLTTLIAFLILSSSALSQKSKNGWYNIDQRYFAMRYQVPTDWEIDGFGYTNWDDGGSSVCDCAGSINSVNRSTPNELFMLVYPTTSKDSLFTGKRKYAWHYEFVDTVASTNFKVRGMQITKTVSTWESHKPKQSMRENTVVWRFTLSKKKYHYVIYFWANEKVMEQNNTLIGEILNRFKSVKKPRS